MSQYYLRMNDPNQKKTHQKQRSADYEYLRKQQLKKQFAREGKLLNHEHTSEIRHYNQMIIEKKLAKNQDCKSDYSSYKSIKAEEVKNDYLGFNETIFLNKKNVKSNSQPKIFDKKTNYKIKEHPYN